MTTGIEGERCRRYLEVSEEETPASGWLKNCASPFDLIVAEGFEERSIGFLECAATVGAAVGGIVIGRYTSNARANAKYHSRFIGAARALTGKSVHETAIDYDGKWFNAALDGLSQAELVVDITGLSTRSLFGVLDAAGRSRRRVTIAYTEAREYWPKRSRWVQLDRQLSKAATIADIIDKQPWLFGYQHHVELIPGHEGYDSVGSGRALVGFLPFKSARLAAVLGEEDYEHVVFVAGCPRLVRNRWRLEALKTINRDISKRWATKEMPTFGYRKALGQLVDLLYSGDGVMERYDVHVALLGSKLQDVACWIASCLIPSITIVTSVPVRYYPSAFSEGIGRRWVFRLTSPDSEMVDCSAKLVVA